MKDIVDSIVTFLREVEFYIILLTLGFFLVLISFFNIGYVNGKWSVIANQFSLLPFISGCLLIILALAVFFLENDTLAVLKTNTSRTKGDLPKNVVCKVSYKDTSINVIYGEIQNFGDDKEDNRYAVVLPANEFFDDDCIYDSKSALGAYITSKFRREDPVTGKVVDQIPKVQELIKEQLQTLPYQEVEKDEGFFQKSYGTGTCLYLERPLSIPTRLLIVAVTQKRSGESIKAAIPFIFAAVDEIRKLVIKHRISRIYIPILGAGHGGLGKEAAFFVLLLALLEVLLGSSGATSFLESVNVIVYRGKKPDKALPPQLLKRNAKIAVNMFNTHR